MKDYSSYVALIVATETEEKAIKNMYDWKPVTFSDDTQTYYSASIEKNGSSHKIVYARQSEMGMTVAVTLTMKLIEHFRPQFMIMVGIAAGIARSDMAEQIYGDVVVADMIWNYTSGNYVVSITVTEFWTPVGMITAVENSNVIKIDGTIYDDWYQG